MQKHKLYSFKLTFVNGHFCSPSHHLKSRFIAEEHSQKTNKWLKICRATDIKNSMKNQQFSSTIWSAVIDGNV